ncbi:type I-E CRISPR-associated protein Cas6/Cse3/CasE [Nocardiopsis changdeensis]|uniref:Type I-E CRISPR-associated protein Cas6/Cse3/CasE n=1 Tax=Nocardiopsis changdeensis TaxID=2831969 RepID=A0ABX8BF67_9ACTN|nr:MULTISPECIES: type I-E CRISPR-associated protein Cas6/Cse3/CasE [Nocardiopsis]QUX20885.1 type I-E CRISPR-associated protein Cas6/Cse3/CasE [Nocardiopsis changdeensis]QYX36817.1 type I-E CRISPR-associated protein Cas6/Cse3/CasE [Nocardiopsis sp. MT53]
MTWLTKITPDLSSRRARAAFSNAGELHRLLIDLASEHLGEETMPSPRQHAGILFRVDEARTGPVLLAQSHGRLAVDRLGDGFGQAAERDLAPFLAGLEKGREVRYRLAATPCKRLGKSEKNAERLGERARPGVNAYTRPLYGADAEQWWRERAERCGLELREVRSTGMGPALDPGRSGRRKVRLHMTRFDGYAVVTDPEAVRGAVVEGVGRGKSFGCGMLSLASAEW